MEDILLAGVDEVGNQNGDDNNERVQPSVPQGYLFPFAKGRSRFSSLGMRL